MAKLRGVALACLLGVLAVVAPATSAIAVPEGPAPGTPDWYAREASNLSVTSGETVREATDPNFALRLETQRRQPAVLRAAPGHRPGLEQPGQRVRALGWRLRRRSLPLPRR